MGELRLRYMFQNTRLTLSTGAVVSAICSIAASITGFLGVFSATAAEAFGNWAMGSLLAVVAIQALGMGLIIPVWKRDGSMATSNVTSNMFIKVVPDITVGDIRWINDQEFSLASWDKVAGELTANWEPEPMEQVNKMHGVYPRCVGFVNGSVVDDEGHLFPLDYWTPNGTGEVFLPKAGSVQVNWLMEISEHHVWDCRDRYNELPPEVPRPTPKVLTHEQEQDIEKGKEMRLLKACDLETWRAHYKGELLIDKDGDKNLDQLFSCGRSAAVANYFAVLPVDAGSVSKYATDGADVLMRHIKASEKMSGREQARLLHGAMSSVLRAHHEQKRWLPRLLRRDSASREASADVVMDSLVDAVVDAADVREKKWMHMLAVGAVARTVRESMAANTAGAAEYKAMEKLFSRFSLT